MSDTQYRIIVEKSDSQGVMAKQSFVISLSENLTLLGIEDYLPDDYIYDDDIDLDDQTDQEVLDGIEAMDREFEEAVLQAIFDQHGVRVSDYLSCDPA